MANSLTVRQLVQKILIALAILLLVICVCTFIGSQKVSLTKAFTAQPDNQQNPDYNILMGARFPRVVLAAIIGAALAAAGVILQAVLRNPLADPYILGISSGAALGVIIAVLSGISWSFAAGSPIAVFAFLGSALTIWLVWFIGHLAGSRVTTLLLAGVVINAFFSAVVMFLTSIADSEKVYSTIFWLMGNITEKNIGVLVVAAVCVLAGIAALFTICSKLNILSFGDEQAKSLGVDILKTRLAAFGLAAFITAVAVSLSGLVGFVGLIVPHAVRLIFGPDHRQLLPISAISGAAVLVIADTIARTIVAPAQLPVGVITAIAGGPFFLILLAKYSRKVSWLK